MPDIQNEKVDVLIPVNWDIDSWRGKGFKFGTI